MRLRSTGLFSAFLPLLLGPPQGLAAKLQPKTLAAWEKYVRHTEQRVERDLQQQTAARPSTSVEITRLETLDDDGKHVRVPDGMIHHWKGSLLVAGATLEQMLKFVQDYNEHHRFFQEVEKSRLVSRELVSGQNDTFRIFYRLKRTKVITVVYNTEHTVTYRRHGPKRASSRGVSTRIAQLEDPGTASEQEKPVGDDSGFFWRLNSYWRFEERDGGVIVECESISLSRSIPLGFAWLVKGFVESVPRESLLNTLDSIRAGLTKPRCGYRPPACVATGLWPVAFALQTRSGHNRSYEKRSPNLRLQKQAE